MIGKMASEVYDILLRQKGFKLRHSSYAGSKDIIQVTYSNSNRITLNFTIHDYKIQYSYYVDSIRDHIDRMIQNHHDKVAADKSKKSKKKVAA